MRREELEGYVEIMGPAMHRPFGRIAPNPGSTRPIQRGVSLAVEASRPVVVPRDVLVVTPGN